MRSHGCPCQGSCPSATIAFWHAAGRASRGCGSEVSPILTRGFGLHPDLRVRVFRFTVPALDADGVANGWIPRPASIHPLPKPRSSQCRGMTPWPPEGQAAWDPSPKTEGLAAGSRWLSEAIPPVSDPHDPPHPGGVPARSRAHAAVAHPLPSRVGKTPAASHGVVDRRSLQSLRGDLGRPVWRPERCRRDGAGRASDPAAGQAADAHEGQRKPAEKQAVNNS